MNFSYSTNPGYSDLVFDFYKAIQWHYRDENWGDYKFPEGFINDLKRYFNSPLDDIYPILLITVLLTVFRYFFEIFFCKVIRYQIE
jgi:hypothetical protein